MQLLQRLQEDMKAAMKAGERQRLDVIRMLISDVKQAEIDDRGASPEQAVEAYAKRLRKSLQEYEKLGKADEAANLRFEIAVVEEYLPKRASAQQTERLVEQFLRDKQFDEKQFGQAMGQFMKQHGQEVDAAVASQVLRRQLAGKEQD